MLNKLKRTALLAVAVMFFFWDAAAVMQWSKER